MPEWCSAIQGIREGNLPTERGIGSPPSNLERVPPVPAELAHAAALAPERPFRCLHHHFPRIVSLPLVVARILYSCTKKCFA